MSDEWEEIEGELEDTRRFQKSLEKATEMKKYGQAEFIKRIGSEIEKNPAKVEVVQRSKKEKFFNKIKKGFFNFFTKFKA